MLYRRLALAAAALAALGAASAQAQSFTLSCASASLTAQLAKASEPYETLYVQSFTAEVDLEAKSCKVRAAEALYVKTKARPVTMKSDPDRSECTVRVDQERTRVSGRIELAADETTSRPILTVNYDLPKRRGNAAHPQGEYVVSDGFPTNKPKKAKVTKSIKVQCERLGPGS